MQILSKVNMKQLYSSLCIETKIIAICELEMNGFNFFVIGTRSSEILLFNADDLKQTPEYPLFRKGRNERTFPRNLEWTLCAPQAGSLLHGGR